MLKLYNTSGLPEYPLTDIENFYITHVSGGLDTVNFDISPKHPMYSKIAEEIKIDYGDNDYLIKSINKRQTVSTISCELDLDFLKETFHKNYNSGSKTIVEILTSILPGWSITNQSLAGISRTIELEGVTNYDIFWECQKVFSLVYEINKKYKTIKLINPDDTLNYGAYFTDELNLTKLEFKGSTTDYVTRLYPYGKDDLTIVSVNGGLEYVQNLSYTNKIIAAYWKDERYTVAQSLKDAAIKKLSELAYPVRAYTCTVLDLAKASTEYDFLTIRMYDRVTLIDRESQIRVEHKVVEYKEYPDEPDRNIITLSTVPKKIQTSIKSVSTQIEKANYTGGFMQQAIKNATELITGQNGGYVVLDPPEKPERILVMNTDNKETASKVWQWNLNGLGYSSNGIQGPYGLAITMNGQMVADYMTTGTLTSILIRSDNYSYTSGNYTNAGTYISLNNGVFRTPNFAINSSGSAFFRGDITSANATLTGGTIRSGNYSFTSGVYSDAGSLINLSNGVFITPNFGINSAGNSFFRGQLQAPSGDIAGCIINSGGLYKNNGSVGFGLWSTTAHNNIVFHAGATNANIGSAPIRFYHNGLAVLENLEINGGSAGSVTCKIHDSSNQYWTDLFGSGIQLRRIGYGSILSMNHTGMVAYGDNNGDYVQIHSTYITLKAANGTTTTISPGNSASLAEWKTNIEKEESLLETIIDTDVYSYNYKYELEKGIDKTKYGFVIGKGYKTPDKVISHSGDNIELYSAIAIAWGGIKELANSLKNLKERVLVLENG